MKEYMLLEQFSLSSRIAGYREHALAALNTLARDGWRATSVYSASAGVLLLEREAVEPKKGGR